MFCIYLGSLVPAIFLKLSLRTSINMIIILKKGVAIFYRRNTPDYTFLRRRKLWELSRFKT